MIPGAGAGRRRLASVVPSSPPWNAPTPLTTPTFDGSGQTVHPDVIDFGPAGWNGWRYWMAHTPYPGSDDLLENPSLLVSANGITWHTPAGLTNPIYPTPSQTGGKRWNSDVDIVHDPTTDLMWLFYRERLADLTFQTFYATSPDGVTWPTPTALNWTRPGASGTGELTSPAIVRRGAGDWLLYGVVAANGALRYWTATDPAGAWAGPFTPTITGGNPKGWHVDVIRHNGKFWMLLDAGPGYLDQPDGYWALASTDGISWTCAAAPFMEPLYTWESGELYRATLQPHENGTHMRVWYSARGPSLTWHVGYTLIPRSVWP